MLIDPYYSLNTYSCIFLIATPSFFIDISNSIFLLLGLNDIICFVFVVLILNPLLLVQSTLYVV